MVSFDLNEAADFLKMHRESLRRLAMSGDVPARKVGNGYLFVNILLIMSVGDIFNALVDCVL